MNIWKVAKPGEHGKGWRVVEPVGIEIKGKEICRGVCEILTSRTSEDNFSDRQEREWAEEIARNHNEHAALVAVAEAAKNCMRYDNELQRAE